MSKLTASAAAELVGKEVTIHARRSNSSYRSEPERITGRVVALGTVFGTYQSRPHALVIDAMPHGVPIVSLARITKVTINGERGTWYEAVTK